ncbi:MAG TPA: hypothetical protein VD887_12735 [Allosphingosinicella sp.]|nr:hypothetical protein [Allosphingosinicella sp.]
MASATADSVGRIRISALFESSLAAHGSGAHPYLGSDDLLRGPDAARNLADAVHFLCTLHGRHPSVIDLAAERTVDPSARTWLIAASEAFAAERQLLAALAVAAGPVPGTPGGSASEAAVVSQRGAIATLGRSERRGCALGAALGLAADWARIRDVLDAAGRRLGVEPPPCALSDLPAIQAVAEAAAVSPPVERALLFGAEQILVQHHGLWALLEAREQARRGI